MGSRFTELVIDCIEPERVAAFWAAALDWRVTTSDAEGVEAAGPPGAAPLLVFVPVPETKTLKNRVHVDVNPVGTRLA